MYNISLDIGNLMEEISLKLADYHHMNGHIIMFNKLNMWLFLHYQSLLNI